MPEICRFFGLIIYVYYDDHDPPHFHVKYGTEWAVFEIKTLALIQGHLPKKAYLLVIEWALENQKSLNDIWLLAKQHQPLPKLPPL